MVTIIVVLSFLSYFVFSCYGQCAPGCGKQDKNEDPVNGLLTCHSAMIDLDNVVRQELSRSVYQCKDLKLNKKDPFISPVERVCRFKSDVDSLENLSIKRTVGENGTFYRISSPFIDSQNCYDDRIYCAYHIACPDDSFIDYQITFHEIENATENGCLDQLSISNDNKFLDSCGEIPDPDHGTRSEGESLLVKFFAGRKCERRGFRISVLCINSSSQNARGCINDTTFSPIFPRSYINHGFSTRRTFFQIPAGSVFRYRNNRIEFITAKFVVKRIYLLLIFDYEEGLFLYRHGSQIKFTGPGRMRIKHGIAIYIDDSEVDLSLRPTDNQRRLIRQFLISLTQFYNNKEASDDDVPIPRTSNLPIVVGSTELCSQASIQRNSCNAVLRFTANLYFDTLCKGPQ